MGHGQDEPTVESVDAVIIDDEADVRRLVVDSLAARDFVVRAATDGQAGLDLVRSLASTASRPVVLLDVMMPHVDGWEVLRRLRSDPVSQHVPVVMLSARTGDADREQAYRLGADACHAMPFSAARIGRSIDELLRTTHEERIRGRARMLRLLHEAQGIAAPPEGER